MGLRERVQSASDQRAMLDRLSRHGRMILRRLRRGSATNIELMELCGTKNFTARISDLRSEGYNIVMTREDKRRGVNVYTLETGSPVRSYPHRTSITCGADRCRHQQGGVCSRGAIHLHATIYLKGSQGFECGDFSEKD